MENTENGFNELKEKNRNMATLIKQKEEIVRILTNNNFKLFEDFDSSLSTSNQIWKNTRFF